MAVTAARKIRCNPLERLKTGPGLAGLAAASLGGLHDREANFHQRAVVAPALDRKLGPVGFDERLGQRQAEAMEVADRVAILNRGRIEQIGAPDDIRGRPATDFVRAFLD